MTRCNNNEEEYAKAYIVPQEYENLINTSNALSRGTIFEDLIRPYRSSERNRNSTSNNRGERYE